MQVRRLILGNTPLLISIPHTGSDLPSEIAASFQSVPMALLDVDWHVERLYEFATNSGA